MPDPVNSGPHGGRFRNETNALASGGETRPTEATDAAGAQMSYMGVQEAPVLGEERQATDAEMRGAADG